MSFFKNMTLARWIILLSFLSAIVLAGIGQSLRGERLRLTDELQAQVPKRAFDMQVAAIEHTQLYGELQREGLKGQSNPDEYIRVLARDSKVQLGSVEINATNPGSPSKDLIDRKYTIEPQDAKAGHNRDRLANYMFLLETESQRVRVTYLRLDPLDKHEPWEIGSDKWQWEIEVTSRQQVE